MKPLGCLQRACDISETSFSSIVVAGRGGIIKDVTIKHVLMTPTNGLLLVADVDFATGDFKIVVACSGIVALIVEGYF